jgi:hypothetical protein
VVRDVPSSVSSRLTAAALGLVLAGCAGPQIENREHHTVPLPTHTPSEVAAHIQGFYEVAAWPDDDLTDAQPISVLSTQEAKQAVVAEWSLFEIHPETRWGKLSPRVVGVLFKTDRRWGEHLGHRPDATGGWGGFHFGLGGRTPLIPYFLSDGRGDNFMRAWPRISATGERVLADAAALSGDLAVEAGFPRAAQLVELEVNGGWGDLGTTPHFVATRGRVIDGTTRYPLRVDDALVMLRGRFDAQLAEQRPAIAAALAQFSERVHIEAPEATLEPIDENIGLSVSWLPENELLDVLVYCRVHQRALGPETRVRPCTPEPCTDGRPCVPCDPTPRVTRDRVDFGRHFAVRYHVDMQGVLVAQITYALRAFQWGIRG